MIILIEADEGYTSEVFTANTKEELKEVVLQNRERLNQEENYGTNLTYNNSMAAALIAMIDQHTRWEEGRWKVKTVEPRWQSCEIIIVGIDGRHASGDIYWQKD